MAVKQYTVAAREVQAILDDMGRGILSLVGTDGGLSLITGHFAQSALVPGSLLAETEHGMIYLPEDKQVAISEWTPNELTPDTPRPDAPWAVSWHLDDCDGATPRQAAMEIWYEIFNRGEPGPEDACVFEVSDPATGESVTVDLAQESLLPA